MRVGITLTLNKKTNDGGLEEGIGIRRICQDLVQVKERALCGFRAFGKVIDLSLIRCIPCIPKMEDK
jgi:hypothetical protein